MKQQLAQFQQFVYSYPERIGVVAGSAIAIGLFLLISRSSSLTASTAISRVKAYMRTSAWQTGDMWSALVSPPPEEFTAWKATSVGKGTYIVTASHSLKGSVKFSVTKDTLVYLER